MVFGLFGPTIKSQEQIADVMNAKDWGAWRGAYADDLLRTSRFSTTSRAVQNSAMLGFSERALGYGGVANNWSEGGAADPDYATRYTDLKSLVVGGHPLLLLTWYDGSHNVGLFRVLTDYNDATSEFLVHDPWYSVPYYRPNVRFKQSFLVDNLWTKYGRWGRTPRRGRSR